MTSPSVSEYPPLVELGRTLAFFTSVIKNGEPWTATCQRDYDRANLALQALAHLPAGSEAVKPVAYLFRERYRDGKGGWWNWSSWSASTEEVATINQDHMQLECIAVFATPPSTPPATNVQEGLEAAIRFVEQRRDDYVNECGIYDPSTGQTEFRDDGEHFGELEEIIEGLQALRSKQAPTVAVPAPSMCDCERGHNGMGIAGRECDCGQTVAVPDEGGLAELTAALAGKHTGEWSNVLELLPASCLETLTDLVRARAEQREAPSVVVGEGEYEAAHWITVHAEDTADGVVIDEADFKRWNLKLDFGYRGHFVGDGLYRLALPAAPTSDGR